MDLTGPLQSASPFRATRQRWPLLCPDPALTPVLRAHVPHVWSQASPDPVALTTGMMDRNESFYC